MRRAHAWLGLLLAAGCARAPAPGAAADPPILVIGLDGFEWNVALPLLRAGRLPHLAGLMARGVAGELETMRPNESPLLWTSIATGKHWTEHGIAGFVKDPRDAGGQRAVQYTSGDRRVKAWWNVLSEHGVSSDTIGWWATWPAEEVLGMIAAPTWSPGTGVKYGWIAEGASGAVHPPELEAQVFETVARHAAEVDAHKRAIFGDMPADLSRKGQRQWEETNWAFRTDSTNAEVLRRRIASGAASRVLAVYLGGADVTGHRFWAALHPELFGLAPDHEVVRAFGHVIPAYYEYVDGLIGELLALLPAETTVLVISDHGMRSIDLDEDPIDLYGVTGNHVDLENPAFFVAAGHGIARRALGAPLAELQRQDLPRLGGIVDFCPTLLALCGVPYGEDMLGRPLTGILDPAFLAAHPPASVPTHDDQAWLARERPSPQVDDPERREQLEQLGYLDGEDR
jgi:predicted AlkP superfamily phosphohydrolase/phosphomutase